MLSTSNPAKTTLIAAIIILALGALCYLLSPFIMPQASQPFTSYVLMAGAVLGYGISYLLTKVSVIKNQPVSIFVGNLPFKANSRQIQNVFAKYGSVHNVRIMMDKATRKPRGYGFVEMGRADAAAAINALNGSEFMGRELKVNIAETRKQTGSA